MNPVDINYLLALMEEIICPESTEGPGFWEEAKGREDPITFNTWKTKQNKTKEKNKWTSDFHISLVCGVQTLLYTTVISAARRLKQENHQIETGLQGKIQ